MSYDAVAARRVNKRAFWLFEFVLNGATYRFTSRRAGHITADLLVWEYLPIVPGDFVQSNERTKSEQLEIKLPVTSDFVQLLMDSPPNVVCTVKILDGFSNDPDQETRQRFVGLVSARKPGFVFVTLSCTDESISLTNAAISRVIQKACPYTLFSRGCGLVRADWETAQVATEVATKVVTCSNLSAFSDGYFSNGKIIYNDTTIRIVEHVGNTLTLAFIFTELANAVASGDVNVTLTPGCKRSRTACLAFDNLDHYGGFDRIDKSVYDGNGV